MLSIDCLSIMGHSVYTYNICVCLHVFGSTLHVLLHHFYHLKPRIRSQCALHSISKGPKDCVNWGYT